VPPLFKWLANSAIVVNYNVETGTTLKPSKQTAQRLRGQGLGVGEQPACSVLLGAYSAYLSSIL